MLDWLSLRNQEISRVADVEAMALHSSTLAWKIPWTEKAGRLQSIGSQSRTRLSDCLPALLHVRKYMTLTRFLLYRAMLGNAILLVFFLHQNQNYVERVKKTPSVTTEIRITFFFLFSKHISVI